MSTSAREMMLELDSKSGYRKFLCAWQYRRLAKAAYGDAKVVFACDLSYHMYMSYHSLCSI